MPLGGASTHFLSTQQLMWEFVDGKELQVRLVDLTTISFNTDEIYVPASADLLNVEKHWETMMSYRLPYEADMMMASYRVHFVASDNSIFPSYSSYGYRRISCLLGNDGVPAWDTLHKVCYVDSTGTALEDILPEGRYVFFTNSAVTVWLARGGPPNG